MAENLEGGGAMAGGNHLWCSELLVRTACWGARTVEAELFGAGACHGQIKRPVILALVS